MKKMYTIIMKANNHVERIPMESEWASNIIAYKMVKEWGWDEAIILYTETGEVIKVYKKG